MSFLRRRRPRRVVDLSGHEGNVFMLIAIAKEELQARGKMAEAQACQFDMRAAGSYDEALEVFQRYVGKSVKLVGRTT